MENKEFPEVIQTVLIDYIWGDASYGYEHYCMGLDEMLAEITKRPRRAVHRPINLQTVLFGLAFLLLL